MKKKWITLLLAVCVMGAVTGCGDKKNTKEKDKVEDTKVQEEKEEPDVVIGVENEGAYEILLTNAAEQDITEITIKSSAMETYPANMMKSTDVLGKEQTAKLFYMPEEQTGSTEVSDKSINPVYSAKITFADGSVYELSSVAFDDIKEASLSVEDGVAFLQYESVSAGVEISTKEQELSAKTMREQAAAQAEAEAAAAAQAAAEEAQRAAEEAQTQNYDNGYDYDAGYGYDPGYDYNSGYDYGGGTGWVDTPSQGSESCLGGVAIN